MFTVMFTLIVYSYCLLLLFTVIVYCHQTWVKYSTKVFNYKYKYLETVQLQIQIQILLTWVYLKYKYRKLYFKYNYKYFPPITITLFSQIFISTLSFLVTFNKHQHLKCFIIKVAPKNLACDTKSLSAGADDAGMHKY